MESGKAAGRTGAAIVDKWTNGAVVVMEQYENVQLVQWRYAK